jgi:hypothetical protein
MDAITTAHQEQARDIRDLKAQRRDDIRIATLEQQVETLQDDAEQAKAISKALAADSETRAKHYAWLAALGSLVLGTVVPLVVKWAVALITGMPLP